MGGHKTLLEKGEEKTEKDRSSSLQKYLVNHFYYATGLFLYRHVNRVGNEHTS